MNERKRIAYAIEQLPDGEDIKKIKGHDELLRLRVMVRKFKAIV